MNKKLTFGLLFFAITTVCGQEEKKVSLDPDIWLYKASEQPLDAVVLDAEAHFDEVGKTKASGYKRFLRWWHRANVNKTAYDGYAKNLSHYSVDIHKKKSKNSLTAKGTTSKFSTWEAMGPFNEIGEVGKEVQENNLGRLMSISIGGENNNILVITSDGGGLWKSLNDGGTWQDMSATLPTLDLSY
ncbi:MAG: hypothetical protein Q4G16_10010, partial [Cruoricaptor ignavus]|nr:hypothetical protein [Cruoricaptor ignavus]